MIVLIPYINLLNITSRSVTTQSCRGNGPNNMCVQRELRSSFPNRGAIRRANALLYTTEVTSDMCDQKW